MKTRAVVIFVSEKAWRVGAVAGGDVSFVDVPCVEGRTVVEQARELSRSASKRAIVPAEVIVALASGWCMNASIDLDGAGKLDHKSLLFELEEQLPIVAEEVLAGFLRRDGKALGICTERARLMSVVEALEGEGWSIAGVCPAAMLALAYWMNSFAGGEAADAVLAQEDDRWTLMPVSDGAVTGWFLMPADVEDLQVRLKLAPAHAAGRAVHLRVIGVAPAMHGLLTRLDGVVVVFQDGPSLEEAAVGVAGAVLNGRRQLPVNLIAGVDRGARRNRAQQAGLVAAVCAVAALVMFAVALFVASFRMDGQTAVLLEEQDRLFHQAARDPHRQPPRQVYRYLTSELQRLTAGGDQGARDRHAGMALQMLSDLFARLPDHLPLQLERLRVEADRVELAGRVMSHEDAGKLEAALGSDGALVVQPPQTSLGVNKSVDFILQVQRAGGTKEQP